MIKLFYVRCHAKSRHGVKDTERMAPFKKLMCVTFVQCPRDEEDNVVNHIPVPASLLGSSRLIPITDKNEPVRDII